MTNAEDITMAGKGRDRRKYEIGKNTANVSTIPMTKTGRLSFFNVIE